MDKNKHTSSQAIHVQGDTLKRCLLHVKAPKCISTSPQFLPILLCPEVKSKTSALCPPSLPVLSSRGQVL